MIFILLIYVFIYFKFHRTLPECQGFLISFRHLSSSNLKMSFLRLVARTVAAPRARVQHMPIQFLSRVNYSAAAGLSREKIEARVLDVLKGYEKVDLSQVSHGFLISFSVLTWPS
jgi:hypothetical protein